VGFSDHFSGLNERRCILRHELGFYRGLATAAVYSADWPQLLDIDTCLKLLGPALQECVDQHPIMAAVIEDPDSEDTHFRRLPELRLREHIHLLDGSVEGPQSTSDSAPKELLQKQKVLEHVVNTPFPDVRQTPPWRLFVLLIPDQIPANDQRVRLLVVYNYSHSHGDGFAGLVFHHTFLQALSKRTASSRESAAPTILTTPDKQLPPIPGPFPLSWTYFTGILAKEFLPWLPKLMFWRQALPGPAWTGVPTFYDQETFRAGVRLINIEGGNLKSALQRCKARGIKLTGLLHLVVVGALYRALESRDIHPTAVTGSTPVDLRKAFGLSMSDMNNCASAVTHLFPPPLNTEGFTEKELQSARDLGAELARCSGTTQDQVVGLLRYAVPLQHWLKGKIGKSRSDTYELSNTMSFDPVEDKEKTATCSESAVSIDSICWTQPADVVGQVFSVNVVSLKGGDLSIAICWQYGALGIAKHELGGTSDAEDAFMDDLSSDIEKHLGLWASNSSP
jgi:hypothetical protein